MREIMNQCNQNRCRSCLQSEDHPFMISIFDVYNNYSISKILMDVTGVMVRIVKNENSF